MATEQEINKVIENVRDLRVVLSNLYTDGKQVITSVFQSLNREDNIDLKLQCSLNLFSNALFSYRNLVSDYLAAAIAGYKELTPEILSGTFTSVNQCFDSVYLQATIALNELESNTVAYWYNQATGTIYNPNGFSTVNVAVSDLASTQFIKTTDDNYEDKFAVALNALEESLRYTLK